MHNRKLLIINADDCALHPLVNQAIINAHQEGIVTSCSILAGGIAFDDAVSRLKKTPALGVGVHLCLVDQSPVLPPSEIPSLTDQSGMFPASYSKFIMKAFMMQIKPDEIRRELFAQTAKIIDSGLGITHLDAHQHLHMIPCISEIVAEISRYFGIRCIRLPKENLAIKAAKPTWSRRLQMLMLNHAVAKVQALLKKHGMSTTDNFFGFSCGGNLTKKVWEKLIPNLPAGSTEVMSHPGINTSMLQKTTGWNYHWEEEYRALCHPQIKASLTEHGIHLTNFGELRNFQ